MLVIYTRHRRTQHGTDLPGPHTALKPFSPLFPPYSPPPHITQANGAGTVAVLGFRRVCYFTNWSRDIKVVDTRFDLDDIEPYLCTHLLYAFAALNASSATLMPIVTHLAERQEDERSDTVSSTPSRQPHSSRRCSAWAAQSRPTRTSSR
ncbi:hypothetical protein C0Q70_00556 [Pomacea canaliculata]|uniref:GH18 domain-containing protein n=1 Tax=Pomacea canaliculata TaxID=400727 RepID=A0A2T7PX12_POMCA|nr:hypothetical protein C0Q70_00556 [Pomacea canaliculata]